jgi:23S rRNA pseudouridine1911/1915/1917 synthase
MSVDEPADVRERWIRQPVLSEEDGWQVRDVLLRSLRLSRLMIKRLAQSGGVLLDGDRPFLSARVREGQWLAVRLSPVEGSGLRPVPMPLRVVLDDPDILVLDKPAGQLVHPSRPSHVTTLAHGVLALYTARGQAALPHPVHRLDRDTTGLVLFATHSIAHQRLDRQIRARAMRRTYLAVASGAVEGNGGRIDAPIGRSPADAHLRTSAVSGADAATRFRVLERLRDATLVEIELETGRTHQIRVHFAHTGHPLIGDVPYGGPSHPAIARQALHAARLEFTHPMTGRPVDCRAGMPDDMLELVTRLRTGS